MQDMQSSFHWDFSGLGEDEVMPSGTEAANAVSEVSAAINDLRHEERYLIWSCKCNAVFRHLHFLIIYV